MMFVQEETNTYVLILKHMNQSKHPT